MTRGDWPQLLAAYRTEMIARGQSPETLRTRMSYLRRWAGTHEPDAQRVEMVSWLANPSWSPATRKSAQGALRSFYGWMVEAGHLEHSPAACLRPVRVPRGLPRPGGLHVWGKGGKDRLIPLPDDLRAELERRPRGWVFPGRFAGHVHPSTVQKRVRHAAGVAPHAHRHRFGTRAYAGTRDMFAVQRLMGHASPETTQVYVELSGDGLAAAVEAASRRMAA